MNVINTKDTNAVAEAGEVIRAGGLVAFPTETVYGIGADAGNAAAVSRIYEVKGRKRGKPLAFLIGDTEEIRRYIDEIPGAATLLMKKFWPGPLTIILRGSGGSSIAFRMPDCRFALEMIREAGVPFAATSANLSDETPPVDADMVRGSMRGKIDLLVDGGKTRYGKGSSIVDLSGEEMRIIREGPIQWEEIGEAINQCTMQNED